MTSEVTLPPNPVALSSIISVVKHEFPNGGNKMEVKSVVRVANNGSKKTKTQDSRNPSKVSKVSYSTEKPVLLLPFGHQVSGRASILCYDETTLLKPYVSRELYFYQTIPKDLKKFTPQFRGLITVSFIEDSRTASMLAYALPHTLVKPDAKSIIKLFTEEPKPHSKRCVKDFGKTHVIYPSKTEKVSAEVSEDSFTLDENDSLFVGDGDFANTVSQQANTSGADEEDVVSELSQGFEINVCINSKKSAQNENEPPYPSTGLHNPWNSKVLDDAWLKLKISESEHHSNGRKKRFTLLENVVARYRRPCVLDLKIGTRVRENASSDKIARHVTAINLGARLSGMQIYDRYQEQFTYHNKYYGHSLTVSGFKANLQHFFSRGTIPVRKSSGKDKSEDKNTMGDSPSPSVDKKLVRKAIEKLKQLRDIVGSIQSHRFYSSSVLLLYEGDTPKEETDPATDENNLNETPMDTISLSSSLPETKINSRSFSFSDFLHKLRSAQHKHRLKHEQNNSPKIHDLQGREPFQRHDLSHEKKTAHGEHCQTHEKDKAHRHRGGNESHPDKHPGKHHRDSTNDNRPKSHKTHEHSDKSRRRSDGDHSHRTREHVKTKHEKSAELHVDFVGEDGKSHDIHDSLEHQRNKHEKSNKPGESRRSQETHEQLRDSHGRFMKHHNDFMDEGPMTRFQNKSWPRSAKDRRDCREATHKGQNDLTRGESLLGNDVEKPIQREDLKRRHNDVSRDKGGDIIDVRMIDFAHYCFHDNEMHPGPDGGFIFGLDNLISLLNSMLKS